MLPTGVPIEHYLYLSAILFSIGAMGVLMRRNIIVLFMCIEMMLNAVNLLLVAFSTYHAQASAQVFVFFIMLVAAAEATVGLAILVMLHRNSPTVDVDLWSRLRN
jgi:NADH-quinone oxidoreductase subunit K